MNKFTSIAVFVLLISVLISLCLGPTVSSGVISVPSLSTLLTFRLPRVLLGIIVGMGLSLSGATLQSMLRNNLASPYTLGVSSAGALGASIGIFLGYSTLIVSMLAVGLSMLSLVLIISISNRSFVGARDYILLVGVSLGFLCSALIVGMQYFGGAEVSFSIQKWLLGSLQTIGFTSSLILSPFLLATALLLYIKSTELDILQVGTEFAIAKGIDVPHMERILLIAIAVLIGLMVSLVGPLSFIGLLVPQVVKLYVSSIHKQVFFYSAIYGASYLILVDSMSRVLIAPSEIPVGVLTSLIGAPIFLFLLVSEKGR
jgi:iron complex transport system permease protein